MLSTYLRYKYVQFYSGVNSPENEKSKFAKIPVQRNAISTALPNKILYLNIYGASSDGATVAKLFKRYQDHHPTADVHVVDCVLEDTTQGQSDKKQCAQVINVHNKTGHSHTKVILMLRYPKPECDVIGCKQSETYLSRMLKIFGFMGKQQTNTSSTGISPDTLNSLFNKLDRQIDFVIIYDYFFESLVLLQRILKWEMTDIWHLHCLNLDIVGTKSFHDFSKLSSLEVETYKHYNNSFHHILSKLPGDFWNDVIRMKDAFKSIQENCNAFCVSNNNNERSGFPNASNSLKVSKEIYTNCSTFLL